VTRPRSCSMPLLNTTPDLLLAVLKKGTVSTNVYL
jgi:hypothetical protein